LRNGQFAEAERLCRRILTREPGNADAHHICGLALAERGQTAAAITHLRQAAMLAPREGSIQENLGRALLATGQLEPAVGAFRAAIAADERRAAAHHGLGVTLARLGRVDEALGNLTKAAALAPDESDFAINLGHAERETGRLVAAERTYRAVLWRWPDRREAWLGLALVLERRELYAEAIRTYTEVSRRFPDLNHDPEIECRLAAVNRADGAIATALAMLEQLRDREPEAPPPRLELARTLSADRRFGEAARALEPLLARHPPDDAAVLEYAQLAPRIATEDRAIALLEQLRDRADSVGDTRRSALFALARLLDDRGDVDAAFAALRQGHLLRRSAIPIDAHRGTAGRLVRAFDPRWFAQAPRSDSRSDVAVLVVGMPRSGTTLVEQILGSHREVAAAGELTVFDDLAQALPRRLNSRLPYPECVRELTSASLNQLASEYLGELERYGGPGKRRIVDKLPHNFQNLGLTALALPQARVIHCRRAPLDTCVSIYFQDFGARQAYARDLLEIGRHYLEYRQTMALWRALGITVHDVDYEALVADAEGVSHRLVQYLGLEWDPNCLKFHENRRAVGTVSAQQVRRPVYQSSVGRWTRYGRHLDDLKKLLQPLGK
jgi:tetratricopeptide (TPR) repeat protein